MTDIQPAPARVPHSRRRRFPTVLLVLLLLLAGLLIGADRGGEYLARQAAEKKLQTVLGTRERPQVAFQGFPWLTQAVNQKFDHVTVHALSPTIRGYEIDELNADLYGLATTLKANQAVADRMSGSARVSWSYVSRQSGIEMAPAGDGKVRVKYPVQVMGKSAQASVVATPRLQSADQTIVFAEPQLEVLGVPMPAELGRQLLARVVRPIKLPLPVPLRATGMTVTDDGAALSFSGDQVNLMALGK